MTPAATSQPARPLDGCQSPRRSARRLTLALALAGAVLLGCGADYTAPAEVSLPPAITTSTAPPADVAACDSNDPAMPAAASYPPLAELPPPRQMPAGSQMAAIQERGHLIVGTSIDTNLFAALDPATNQIVGFDIDMAKLVALAIFGGSWDTIDERLELRGITFAQRVPALVSGEVDLVAHTMTINCERWQQVAFSGTYLNAGQKLLVATDSDVDGLDDLSNHAVCVSAGGTSADEMAGNPEIRVVEVSNQTDCVVKFQRGEVDVIRSDDTILAGFVAQDPFAKIAAMDPLTEEPYGLAVSLEHPELVQFVNTVLEQAKASDDPTTSWSASYDRWLRPSLGAPLAELDLEEGNFPTGVPVGVYDRPLPR